MSIDAIKPKQITLDVYILVIHYRVAGSISVKPFSSFSEAQQLAVDYCRDQIEGNYHKHLSLWKLSENAATHADFVQAYNEMRGYSEVQIMRKKLAV